MATDATGTPTPLGIPTYNVNVDAPTGNGFNGAMSVIDGLISTAQKFGIKAAGVLIGSRRNINFIQGSGATLSVVDDSVNDKVDVTISATGTTSLKYDKDGTNVGTRGELNFIEGSNVTLTVADNPGASRGDITINAATALAVDHSGAAVGTRPTINLIDGSNVTLTVSDNPGSNRVDVTIASSSPPAIPTGAMHPYAGASAPSGYLLCDGSAVSRTTYAALFAAIGSAYGAGDGSTTFNVPDTRGRALFGKGTHADVSTLGNADSVAVANRRPKHNHTVTDPGHNHDPSDAITKSTIGVKSLSTTTGSLDNATMGMATTGISVGVGGTAAVDSAPYVVVNHIIKT